MKHILSAFVAIVVSFFFVNTAFAQEADSILTPLYGVGQAEISASSAAQEICRQWQSCEADSIDCHIVVEAATSNNEHVVRSRGTSFEFVDEAALGLARQANLVQQIQWACPASASDLDIKPGLLWPHKQPSLSYRYAWATVRPAVDAAVLAGLAADLAPPPTACNDGEDNDGDGKVDLLDPGCENAQDESEWNLPTDVNVRWADLVPVILAEAATPCPVTITGWWSSEDRQFHYKVEYGSCPSDCRTSDVSEKMPGYQMMSPKGIAAAAQSHTPVVASASATGALKWSELRVHIEAPERAPGIEYLDSTAATTGSNTMWFGRAADVTDRGDLIVISFKSVCEDLIMAELDQEYGYLDFVVAGSSTVGSSFFGTGHSIPSAATGSLVAEFGLEGGSPNLAFLGTLGVGALFDANCDQPVGMLAQLRLAAVTHRSGPVGLFVGTRIQGAWAVNDTLVVDAPDDPETTENEWAGHYERQLGSDAYLGWVDIGPRVAFSPRGVHSGWILPTLSAGPGLRSVNNDLVLSGQVGGQLAVGGTF